METLAMISILVFLITSLVIIIYELRNRKTHNCGYSPTVDRVDKVPPTEEGDDFPNNEYEIVGWLPLISKKV